MRLSAEFVPADCVGGDEGLIDQLLAHQHMQEAVGERRIGAGEGLQMKIRLIRRFVPDRIDDDHLGRRLLQPEFVPVRCRGRRVGAPDHDAGGILGHARVEAVAGGAIEITQRRVAGGIADAVRIDFAGAELVEEALREAAGDG